MVNNENKIVNTPIEILVGNLKDNYVVTSGLKNGDKVVVEGITGLRDGMEIKPKLTENKATAANLSRLTN